ncbi:hypothetical protein [Dyella acidiphila]|uniref:PilZ domain-containing protein n=1 Tax=Dyella acidiphila TaxID=2775866 RepID=A0ABR9G472_9GAMM|nr:hypothetical protein [Dyella acidiphila]MBE1158856.1 hypothetical protein [Dyella acidiphila]
MFGWLANRSSPLCCHAPRPLVARRSLRVSAQHLIGKLPSLGSVLYLHNASTALVRDTSLPGLLVAERSLSPLLDTYGLIATSVVTDDGPREWLECVDRSGWIRARLHLLPDTDYLAWDGLINACAVDDELSVRSNAPPLRPDSAAVLNFTLRELGGLQLLERGRPAPLSPLGDRVAARIAQAESALLSR